MPAGALPSYKISQRRGVIGRRSNNQIRLRTVHGYGQNVIQIGGHASSHVIETRGDRAIIGHFPTANVSKLSLVLLTDSHSVSALIRLESIERHADQRDATQMHDVGNQSKRLRLGQDLRHDRIRQFSGCHISPLLSTDDDLHRSGPLRQRPKQSSTKGRQCLLRLGRKTGSTHSQGCSDGSARRDVKRNPIG